MKYIVLNECMRVIVDDDDYLHLSQYDWKESNGYAVCYLYGYETRTLIMHREIMNCPKGMVVDHINGIKLDNRKENLRICTQTENNRNARLRKDNTSGYKGVYLDKQRNKWTASINLKGKNIKLGRFDNIHDAARMYNFWAVDLYGEFACLNKIRG